MILPNGTNIQTEAGDTALFISEGSDAVRCVIFNKVNYQPVTRGLNSAPAATTSTTGVMAGLNKTLTPKLSGRVLVIISGQAQNGTGDNGFKFDLRHGTGSAPTNGAALTGTVNGATVTGSCVASGSTTGVPIMPFCHHAVITGLTINTAYWFDIGQYAVTGGTATFSAINVTIIEI